MCRHWQRCDDQADGVDEQDAEERRSRPQFGGPRDRTLVEGVEGEAPEPEDCDRHAADDNGGEKAPRQGVAPAVMPGMQRVADTESQRPC